MDDWVDTDIVGANTPLHQAGISRLMLDTQQGEDDVDFGHRDGTHGQAVNEEWEHQSTRLWFGLTLDTYWDFEHQYSLRSASGALPVDPRSKRSAD